ncbi:hypothetical protein H1P_520020 [Hyella patelloides LEGE 07179]|uniref:Uncharacterized protein n=1 Tax=Hyella patelloides LEGE 07179 TaxID=945734 RepID=A0A563VZX3_9CYAN|nr:hypothetical protein [Hyella patelloides]VEP16979.1 hypothetical protein H1P_520020 [Hyella patelloides LEGE 07179]
MSKVIYGKEFLSPLSTWGAYGENDYAAEMLMVEGKKHKIFITPAQRDDFLEGYNHGFILQINEKRLGCYWLYDDEFEITEDGTKVWHLDEIGIEPSMSSTNQFTTHRYFDSEDEMVEGIEFIQAVFSEYDAHTGVELINDEPVMIWTKTILCQIRFSSSLQNKIDNGELVAGVID